MKNKEEKEKLKGRKNKKHFILFNNGGVISATTPKDWARANQNKFPKHTFSDADNTPTVAEIENLLFSHGFSIIKNKEIVITYNYKTI